MKFGEKLKKIRETFYLSQKQLSVISNIPLESIIKYEEKSIDPDFENLGRLEDLLEVDRKILMNDEARRNKIKSKYGFAKFILFLQVIASVIIYFALQGLSL